MMKKVLILMLVLGFVSSASALTVTLDPNGSQLAAAGNYSIDVVSDEDTTGYDYFLVLPDDTYGSIDSVVDLPAAGDDGVVTSFGDMAGYFDVFGVKALDMSAPFDSILAGVQFQADITFTGAALGENLTVLLLNGQLETLDSMTYEGVPEPMTIALLGLGGLFLLRRRK
jgi:hypothetical protein